MSKGIEATVKNDVAKIDITLVGSDTISIPTGKKYTDTSVKVTENDIDVTSKATIDYTIVRKSDNKAFNNLNELDITKPDTYIITYIVKYKTSQKTLKRIITYVPNTEKTTTTTTTTVTITQPITN